MALALRMLTFASQWPPPWPGPRLAGCWWLGYVTSSTHVWHGNCTATGTWTPPCARHGVSQYLKCAPCIHCLPIVLLLFPSLKINYKRIYKHFYLLCAKVLVLFVAASFATVVHAYLEHPRLKAPDTCLFEEEKNFWFGWFYGKLRCPVTNFLLRALF